MKKIWIVLGALVLSACGSVAQQPASSPAIASPNTAPPETGRWEAVASMSVPRAHFTATLLPDGKVLVAGGVSDVMVTGSALSSVEIYDPSTKKFAAGPSMPLGLAGQTATVLRDGRVLVVGGYTAPGNLAVSMVQIYYAASRTWSTAAPMHQGRTSHAAVLIPGGKVLVTGGNSYASFGNSPHGSAPASLAPEIYDPAANSWSVGSMPKFSRPTNPTATLLRDGRVLVVGGQDMWNSPDEASEQSEIYDPAHNSWSLAAPDTSTGARQNDTATLLANGQVLVAGGSRDLQPTGFTSLYSPSTNKWIEVGNLSTTRTGHSAHLLKNGNVVVVGGAGVSVEEYVPGAMRWFPVAPMSLARGETVAVNLQDGSVLVLGGVIPSPFGATGAAELFQSS
jgi:Kelch motif protein